MAASNFLTLIHSKNEQCSFLREVRQVQNLIYQDTETTNPLQDCDHLGLVTMYHNSRSESAILATTNKSDAACRRKDWQIENILSLRRERKLYSLWAISSNDRSGECYANEFEGLKFDREDLEQCKGFYIVTREDSHEFKLRSKNSDGVLWSRRQFVNSAVKATVKMLSQFYSGDVYGYVIERKGEEINDGSCWGFYGLEYAKENARDAVLNDAIHRIADGIGAKVGFKQDREKPFTSWYSFTFKD